ncbi:hypothetical protein IH980_02410 [Patescibacteria group bacterium]|nr:hypothetical protein [Patescibacteria group bacterium]
MAVSRLYKQREEVEQLVEIAGLASEEKKRWKRLVPRMLPSELLRLKRNLLRQLLVDAELETVNEIVKRKKAPKDAGLIEMVLARVLEKVDKVEERTRSTSSGQAKRVVGK